YLPQLKLNLAGTTTLAEKIFAPNQTSDPLIIKNYVTELVAAYNKA
ncbi:MAG: protochlorophyllide oxidoreductase, partial [Chlorobiaceae bacterium]|nr:protochlorophyllide oxidoreductase [Chlorobiaceae bacterium]